MADKPTSSLEEAKSKGKFYTDRDLGDEDDSAAKETAARLRKAFSQKELDAIKKELDSQ